MLRHFRTNALSVLPVIALAAGLGGCGISPAYVAEQLEAIPLPAPILMKHMADPDCRLHSRLAVAAGTEKPEAKYAAPDFENESSGVSNPNTSSTKKTNSRSASPDLKDIQKERDCYRRAEQVARTRFNELQASTTETVAALDEVKHHVNAQSLRPHWWDARVVQR